MQEEWRVTLVATRHSSLVTVLHASASGAAVGVVRVADTGIWTAAGVGAPPPNHIVIATGGKTGAYYQFAQKYAEELRKQGVTLEVRETAGSVENLELLLDDDNSDVGIAIVQSGVASPEQRNHFYALGSLYREPLWVFHRSEVAVNRGE